MDTELLEAKAKLAARFGNTQIGGKGTQRRKHKHVNVKGAEEDPKVKAAIKKFGV